MASISSSIDLGRVRHHIPGPFALNEQIEFQLPRCLSCGVQVTGFPGGPNDVNLDASNDGGITWVNLGAAFSNGLRSIAAAELSFERYRVRAGVVAAGGNIYVLGTQFGL